MGAFTTTSLIVEYSRFIFNGKHLNTRSVPRIRGYDWILNETCFIYINLREWLDIPIILSIAHTATKLPINWARIKWQVREWPFRWFDFGIVLRIFIYSFVGEHKISSECSTNRRKLYLDILKGIPSAKFQVYFQDYSFLFIGNGTDSVRQYVA